MGKFEPGAVCQIVGVHRALEDLRGRFVTIVAPIVLEGVPSWSLSRRVDLVIRAPGFGPKCPAGETSFVEVLPEKYLRPLDKPSDDEWTPESRRLPEVMDVEGREVLT